jgi:hypothetical protein
MLLARDDDTRAMSFAKNAARRSGCVSRLGLNIKHKCPALGALFGFLLAPGLGWAQHASQSDQEIIQQLVEQIKQLQQKDQELEQRIEFLERGKHPADLPPPEPAPAQPSQTTEQPPALPSPLPREWHDVHGIQWHGFGELDYKVLNQRRPETGTYGFVPGSAGNFYTGDFGLFLTARIGEKASALSEMVIEEGDAQSYTVDLRRLLLKYDYNDHLKISLGRYQTGIGYYNWAFRSAAWLQTTADRPLVMEYASSGGILPTQAVGIYVSGAIPSGTLGLNYIAEYGSSDTVRRDINGDGLSNDENNGNHINIGLFATPDRVRGLRIGGSFYHDQISNLVFIASSNGGVPAGGSGIASEEPSSTDRWNQTIVNGHVIYTARGIEFLNEGFLIRHALIGSASIFNTSAFYSQFSKKLGRIRPFVRYQYVNASPRNPIYDDIGLRYGPSFGARYDLNDFIAFKAQLDHTVRRGLPDLDGLHLQLAFTF